MTDKLAIEGGSPIRKTALPYARQHVDEADCEAVVQVLRSSWLTTGPQVRAFEDELAAYLGAADVVVVSNGTAALHAIAHALGVGPGDEVLVPAMTFAASANGFAFQGATPVFVDVDPRTLLIDPADARRKITPRTKALVAVDYAGQPCDYGALSQLSKDTGVRIVSDGCHALGASYRDRKVGVVGELTAFSFHPAKHITTGEGGAISFMDRKYSAQLRSFRNHGIDLDHEQRALKKQHSYAMQSLGYNYRLNDFQCALGLRQLSRLPGFLGRRREIAKRYDEGFAKIPGVKPLARMEATEHAYHLYIALLDLESLRATRDEIFHALHAEGIAVNVHYMPVHLHPYYRNTFHTKEGDCPKAEDAYRRLLSLPMFPAMTDDDVSDVLAGFTKVLAHFRS